MWIGTKIIARGFQPFTQLVLLIAAQHYLENAQHIPTALLHQAQMGDTSAMQLLYQQYSKAMFNICIRMTGNHADAEDVLQEAFVQAFTNLRQLNNVQAFGGWLKRIVVNACIKHSKKNVYWQEWEDETHEMLLANEEEAWWLQIDMALVHQQIKALPNGCRQVFNLFVLENYSHKDIAGLLGISEGTSKSQYHRAKQLLKQNIMQQLQHHG